MRLSNSMTLRSASMLTVLASTLVMAACSSDDDDDNSANPPASDTVVSVSVPLTTEETAPPAMVTADGSGGQADFTIDTETGAVTGSATVMGLTGPATAAHIHQGVAGEPGDIVITLVANEDASVWSAPENAALDAPQIALFQANELYVNIHTEANSSGELRGQLIAPAAEPAGPEAGSFTFTFRNTSDTQPMTPPVVALHTPMTDDGGIRVFEVGQPASGGVIQIAENGNNAELVEALNGQTETVSAVGVAAPDPAGPLLPGSSSSITLTPSGDDQVLSLVSMVVCTNDGFSGIDSMELPTEATTMTAPIYDAGSEVNVLQLAYWVPPCGGPEGNLGDAQDGAIAEHPGQEGSENPDFDFAAGSQLLEVTITPN